jgi:hypothetical protein
LEVVEKENERLSKKMEEIFTHAPRFLDNHNKTPPKPSLNVEARMRETEKIAAENQVMIDHSLINNERHLSEE